MNRHLGPFGGISLALGAVVGAGIFSLPGEIARFAGSTTTFLSIWLIGGIVTLSLAWVLSRICMQNPVTAADYVVLKKYFGENIGFVYVWMIFWVNPYIWSILAIIASEYLLRSFNLDLNYTKHVAIFLILAFGIFHSASLRLSFLLQTLSSWGNIALLTLICLLIFIAPIASNPTEAVPMPENNLGRAFSLVMFTYGGLPVFATLAGEMKIPDKTIPVVLISSAIIITVTYLTVNVAFLWALSFEGLVAAQSVVIDALAISYDQLGAQLVGLIVFVMAISGLNAIIITTPRVLSVFSENYRILYLLRLSIGKKSPTKTIYLSAAVAILYILFSDLGEMASALVLGLWPFYILMTLGYIINLGKLNTNNAKRLIDSLFGITFVLAATIFLGVLTFYNVDLAIYQATFMLAGLVVAYVFRGFNRKVES